MRSKSPRSLAMAIEIADKVFRLLIASLSSLSSVI
jgi:hypothetical protein